MITRESRHLWTRLFVDKLFKISQASSQQEKQDRSKQFIQTDLQKPEVVFSNLFNDVMHRWATEQPKQEALRTYDLGNDRSEKVTFSDLYRQASRLANVLTGKEFHLQAGKTVLVLLPASTPERLFLQLACLQSGLIFCPYDPKYLTNEGISQRMQKLAIDCIITNEENFEIARRYTYNPLRPLKKGLITNCSALEPLPVGWIHLMRSAHDAESEFTPKIAAQPETPVLRFLSKQNQVIQYSQKDFNLELILSALWLNINQISRLIWMKNSNDIITIAPWIFGSSIFLKETEDLQAMLKTFEQHPIDTFCASSTNYQMLKTHSGETRTHLTQLFSTESVDPATKARWHSMTNLHIHDDYDEFKNQQSRVESLSNNVQEKIPSDEKKHEQTQYIYSPQIPLEKFIYQYPVNQDQKYGKPIRV